MKEKNIMWAPWDQPGLEHIRMVQNSKGTLGDGMILGINAGMPFRALYKIQCDLAWKVRSVEINLLDDTAEDIRLRADGRGHWTDDSGNAIAFLNGCIDMDISASAFTNTLAIRRIGLKPNESSELSVAFIAVPEMEVKQARQRYTCLELTDTDALYKYEDQGLFPGFKADLRVDSHGLIIDYPELFRRAWSG